MTSAYDNSVLVCCRTGFERWSADAVNDFCTVLEDDRHVWSCCVPVPGDPSRHLTICLCSQTMREMAQTVCEIRTLDATLIRPFPPCKDMRVCAIQATQHALFIVHENRAMTLLDGTAWEPIFQGPAPPFTYEYDMPHACLDWSGEWAGIHVPYGMDEKVAALAVWHFNGITSEWVVGDPVAIPGGPCYVDMIVPVPKVPAAWLLAIGPLLVYARVDLSLGRPGRPVCDVVMGSADDFAPCECIEHEFVHPVSDTAMLINTRHVPEYIGGNYVVKTTWTLPDLILRDQGRKVE